MARFPRIRLSMPTARLPRMQFTVRRLMVAVAILALVFGGWQAYARHRLMADSALGFRKKSIWYSSMAKNYASEATICAEMITEKKKNPDLHPNWDLDRLISVGTRHRAMANYYENLSARYGQAARSPLDPVPPDPPMP